MKLKIDHENDASYFRLTDEAIFESEEVQPGVILDFDEQGRGVGVEMLTLSARIEPEKPRVLQFETTYWFRKHDARHCFAGRGLTY
jgi:uncharacterized protein YuzE